MQGFNRGSLSSCKGKIRLRPCGQENSGLISENELTQHFFQIVDLSEDSKEKWEQFFFLLNCSLFQYKEDWNVHKTWKIA